MSEVVIHKSSSEGVLLSDAVIKHFLAYLDEQKDCKGVRLSVKKTGCSGLSYVVDYVKVSEDSDVEQPLANQYKVYIDKASFPFLKGMTIDYQRQGLNYKLVFTNPNQTGQCGCGESFTVG